MSLDALFKSLTSFKTREAREAWMEPRITEPHWSAVPIGEGVTIQVSSDYMGIDGVPLPMSAPLATRVARRFGALLPTRVLVDRIYHAPGAEKIPAFTSSTRNIAAWRTIHEKCLPYYSIPGVLLVGHRKDVIRAPAKPGRLVIYGWHGLSGKPIQPVNGVSHDQWYTDYSQGIRLVRDPDGSLARLYEAGDPLVSDVGPIAPEYPMPTTSAAPRGVAPASAASPRSGGGILLLVAAVVAAVWD